MGPAKVAVAQDALEKESLSEILAQYAHLDVLRRCLTFCQHRYRAVERQKSD